jgi:hypothetical protein
MLSHPDFQSKIWKYGVMNKKLSMGGIGWRGGEYCYLSRSRVKKIFLSVGFSLLRGMVAVKISFIVLPHW